MFTYIDPTVKKQLIAGGKLFCLRESGERCQASPDETPFLTVVGPIPLPVRLPHGSHTFQWYAWVRNSDLGRIEASFDEVRALGPKILFNVFANYMAVNSILVCGPTEGAQNGLATPLVRVHSNCMTGDVFGSMRCDCGPQLITALERIAADGVGALVYMAGHEGRGIGLWAKAVTYLLQDAGQDTYQANEKLGLPVDSRDFSDAGRILRAFYGTRAKIRLLGNNPLKRKALTECGVEVVTQEPLVVGVNAYNQRYLSSKRQHGHLIAETALDGVLPKLA
jgi:GTP cyclohydrolase II